MQALTRRRHLVLALGILAALAAVAAKSAGGADRPRESDIVVLEASPAETATALMYEAGDIGPLSRPGE